MNYDKLVEVSKTLLRKKVKKMKNKLKKYTYLLLLAFLLNNKIVDAKEEKTKIEYNLEETKPNFINIETLVLIEENNKYYICNTSEHYSTIKNHQIPYEEISKLSNISENDLKDKVVDRYIFYRYYTDIFNNKNCFYTRRKLFDIYEKDVNEEHDGPIIFWGDLYYSYSSVTQKSCNYYYTFSPITGVEDSDCHLQNNIIFEYYMMDYFENKYVKVEEIEEFIKGLNNGQTLVKVKKD